MFTLEVERFLVRLRLTSDARFRFNHGGALMGLLCRALQTHELHAGLTPFACESGRVRFGRGDGYYFGLTLAGAARHDFDPDRFASALNLIGERQPAGDGPRPTLAGNFEVVSVERLPPRALEAEAARLRAADSLSLRFLSPLRLGRPHALRIKGASFLNRDCFPADHFLLRLAYRLFLLAHGRYPDDDERDELRRLSVSQPGTAATRRDLFWLDIPLEGGPDKREQRPQGYTLGGVVGRVTLQNVPASWLAPLVLGQYVHAGEKTHFGLGRYAIEECAVTDDPFRPALTFFDNLLDPALLQDLLRRVTRRSDARGVDGYAPGDLSDCGDLLAEQLSTELRASAYRPAPLMGHVAPKDSNCLRPLAVPTVRDRVLQQAACVVLSPHVGALLEDCASAYRKGFSRAGAARAVERAYDEGFRHVLDASLESFFDAVEWERLFTKVEALFPFDPLVPLLKEWVRAPVIFGRNAVKRERGLPQGVAVSPLLAKLYLDEFNEALSGTDFRLVRHGDDFVVLCKNIEAARRASDEARRKLAEVGLKLDEEKTATRSLDEGFTYLGYLFLRAHALEKEGEARDLSSLTPNAGPQSSWLAQVPFERVRPITELMPAASRSQTSARRPHGQSDEVAPRARRPAQVPVALETRVERAPHERAGDRLAVHEPATHVVVYDIADEAIRRRVASLLGEFGRRVQESVFECRLSAGELEEMQGRLGRELGQTPCGQVRIYNVRAICSQWSH